ncbi:TPA: ParB family protein [Pseudomonas aeruginosa 449A]|nr:ParB family protein [Pseudomonas aeruginosa 449A]
MADQGLTDKLLAAGFERAGPVASELSDPIADTPMVVTLDQLRPYEHDPRVKRNPLYEEIKASIRERGLDAAPAITRRPGESHYIIRNGGNTRLAILRELWTETKDTRFFRISCLFRPWPERGEIISLTGHLAENELHGGLTFIERALGIEKARELYEIENGKPLSQSELSRRLAADGYPIQQSYISRMQDAVRHLLPAVPNLLYGGLGRHQVERLCTLRNASARIWAQHAKNRQLPLDFDTFFQELLAPFDSSPESFSSPRVQDELIGQMAELLQLNYDSLALDLLEGEQRNQALGSDPTPATKAPPLLPATLPAEGKAPAGAASTVAPATGLQPPSSSNAQKLAPEDDDRASHSAPDDNPDQRVQQHIVSPADTTERLQGIQKLVADRMGDNIPDFESNALQAIPVQAGGLYPISDVWYIEPGLDVPDRLRVYIAQFATEIADEFGMAEYLEADDHGIGYHVDLPTAGSDASPFAQAVISLLMILSEGPSGIELVDSQLLVQYLAQLFHGHGGTSTRLSDTALVKLFRLLRLARRLQDLESSSADHGN